MEDIEFFNQLRVQGKWLNNNCDDFLQKAREEKDKTGKVSEETRLKALELIGRSHQWMRTVDEEILEQEDNSGENWKNE